MLRPQPCRHGDSGDECHRFITSRSIFTRSIHRARSCGSTYSIPHFANASRSVGTLTRLPSASIRNPSTDAFCSSPNAIPCRRFHCVRKWIPKSSGPVRMICAQPYASCSALKTSSVTSPTLARSVIDAALKLGLKALHRRAQHNRFRFGRIALIGQPQHRGGLLWLCQRIVDDAIKHPEQRIVIPADCVIFAAASGIRSQDLEVADGVFLTPQAADVIHLIDRSPLDVAARNLEQRLRDVAPNRVRRRRGCACRSSCGHRLRYALKFNDPHPRVCIPRAFAVD